ncbi:RCC1 domain-containing protein [Kitasatospora sp. NPDC089913]|uniref:RCC1 domain-containing protein n=1 Tax=Kitasatospora sp. NPDC089913 TaxID=3364080 RepID=UPI0037FDFDE8
MRPLHRKLRRLPVTAATAVPAVVASLTLLGSVALPTSAASAYDLRLRSWGLNASGQLGDGTKTQRLTPTSVVGLSGAELTSVAAGGTGGSAGSGFGLALLANGTVESWGKNDKGQLGNGATSATDEWAVPSLVAGLGGVQAVAAGGSHALALLKDGTVRAWGLNDKSQLGDGTTTNANLPVTVAGLEDVKAIAAGDTFSMALLKDGTVKTWGNNDKGQLGVTARPASSTAAVPAPTPATRTTAVAVPELTTVKGITAGASHALALLADGTVMAWGLNDKGQLGDDTVVNKPYPVGVLELKNVTELAGGASHSLALLQDRTLRGWGLNTNGQVGDGTTTQRNTSVPIPGVTGVTGIAAGAAHNLAVLSDGTVQAWGLNDKGQLGDGTTTQRNNPVQVLAKSGSVSMVAAPSNGSFSLAR